MVLWLFEHSKGNGQCSLFFNICYINSFLGDYYNCILLLNTSMKDLLEGSSRKCRCACPVFYCDNDRILGVNLLFCLPQSSNDSLAQNKKLMWPQRCRLPPHLCVCQVTWRPSLDRHHAYHFPWLLLLVTVESDSLQGWITCRIVSIGINYNRPRWQLI